EVRQSRKVRRFQRQGEALLIRQYVLAESRAEHGEALRDRRKPALRRRVEIGAGAPERKMIALEHAALLRRQAQFVTSTFERVDAAEQRGVHEHVVAVRG